MLGKANLLGKRYFQQVELEQLIMPYTFIYREIASTKLSKETTGIKILKLKHINYAELKK